MDKQKSKQSVALSSVFASAALTLMKLVVGLLTGSLGILSEAAHSLLDFFAALLTFFAVRIGDKPPDLRHPYGHGKVESVSAFVETGLLFLTSAWIIYEAFRRLFYHTVEVEVKWYSFLVVVVSIIVDYSRSRALTRVAKQTHSQALEADALHFSSDILSSLVVLIGLVFIVLGINKADSFAAIGVSFFILHAGYVLGKRTIDVLVDAAPEGLTERIAAITKKVNGVIGIEKLRIRPVGASVFVDMIVTVSRRIPLEKTESICQNIEKNIIKTMPEVDLTIQTKPLSLDTESIIEQVQIVAKNHDLSVHDVVVHKQNEKKYLSFDLEVNSGKTIREAHKITSHLEKAIKEEIGEDVEINSHIEPVKSEIIVGENVSTSEKKEIEKQLEGIALGLNLIKGFHKVEVRKADAKFFISLHCLFEDSTLLEDAHSTSSRFEYLAREKIPQIQRLVVHAEPLSKK